MRMRRPCPRVVSSVILGRNRRRRRLRCKYRRRLRVVHRAADATGAISRFGRGVVWRSRNLLPFGPARDVFV